MKQRAKGVRRGHTRVRTAKRDARVGVLRSPSHEGSSLALARSLPTPALGEGASTSAPGEIKIVSEKHGVKKETPLKNVLQVGILIIYIMGLKLVVGVG